MEYQINQLARLSGVSARTLRYYHQIGLLAPERVEPTGYRVYGRRQVDLLQQILLYRELGIPLAQIKEILYSPGFRLTDALTRHLAALRLKKQRIEGLITTVEKTIAHQKGAEQMSDQEKFEAFKQQLMEDNMRRYGDEIIDRYGKEQVEASNRKLMGKTKAEMAEMTRLEQAVKEKLAQAMATGDPGSASAKELVALHKQWLLCSWTAYSPEAHKNLAQMYLQDPRFTAYYDAQIEGAAQFLRDAIHQNL